MKNNIEDKETDLLQEKSAVLGTARLILRPFTPEDAAGVYQYASDPEIGWNCGWPAHTSVENSREVIQSVLMIPKTWAITPKEHPEQAIGSIALLDEQHANENLHPGELEIGYWIGRPFWNQGFASEAAQAVKDYAFDVLGVNALVAGYADFNPASGKVQHHLGMTQTGSEKVFVQCLNNERTIIKTRIENTQSKKQ